MSGYHDTEDEYRERIRSLKYAYNRFVDGKISYYDYMSILDDNYDILTGSQMDEVKAWETELVKKAEQEKIEKQKAQYRKELRQKENENWPIIILAFLSIIILILMAITGSFK
jgi:hypothetical protein